MSHRVSGWILPDGTWLPCNPWEHIRAAKQIHFLIEEKEKHLELARTWADPDEEKLRTCLASMGFVKVCYHLVDADGFNNRQLRQLQELYSLLSPDDEIEFIGRIQLRLPVRLLLKLKDAERLNALGRFG